MNLTARVNPAAATTGRRGAGTPRGAVVAAALVAATLIWPAAAGAVPAPGQAAAGPSAAGAVAVGSAAVGSVNVAVDAVTAHPATAPVGRYNPRLVTLWVTGTTSASVTWRRPRAGAGITGYLVGMSVQYPDGNGGWGAWTGWKTKMFAPNLRRVALTTVTPGLRIRVGVRTKYSWGWGGSSIAYATLDSPTPTPEPEPSQTTPAPEPSQTTPAPEPSQSTSTPPDCSQYPEGSMDWILCNHDPNT